MSGFLNRWNGVTDGDSIKLRPDSQASHESQTDGLPRSARCLSARLGHGSIRTTQEIYSHMIHGQDDAGEGMGEAPKSGEGRRPESEGASVVMYALEWRRSVWISGL